MSKVFYHFQTPQRIPRPEWGPGMEEDPVTNLSAYCQSAVAVIMMDGWSPAKAQELRRVCPKTFILGRMYDHARSMDRVIAKANELGGPAVFSAICGGNEGDWGPEPVMDAIIDLDQINLTETENAVKAHAAGYRYGMGSWSYGAVEQLNAAPWRWAYMKKALEKADVLVIHSYGSNEQAGGVRDRSLDYRKTFADMPVKRPIFIKEFGPDFALLEAVVRGEAGPTAQYIDMLKAWDIEWAKDPYLIGATLWNFDSGKYQGGIHDLNRNKVFVGNLANYLEQGIPARKYWDWSWAPPVVPPPAPLPIPVPTPVPAPGPSSWPQDVYYFKPIEFRHPEKVKPEVLRMMEVVRRIWGTPLRVTRDYGTPEENAAVGGHPQSWHLTGDAIDFVPGGLWTQRIMAEMNQIVSCLQLLFPDFDIQWEIDDTSGRRHFHLGVRSGTGHHTFIPRG